MLHQIQISAQRYKSLQFSESKLLESFAVLEKVADFSVPPGELSIVFLSDDAISQLHGNYLQDPTPTDVITFPGDPAMDFAGEICVSVDHAIAGSQQHATPFAEELTLYIVHGYLHLAGLDDIEETDRLHMRAAEAAVMQQLRDHAAIPDFRLEQNDA
jgi:probable rRNA maturation factor